MLDWLQWHLYRRSSRSPLSIAPSARCFSGRSLAPCTFKFSEATLGTLTNVLSQRLYGLTVHQTYRYFKLYPKDRLYLKSLVRLSPFSYSERTPSLNGICQVLTILCVLSLMRRRRVRAHLSVCQSFRDATYRGVDYCHVSQGYAVDAARWRLIVGSL